MKSQISVDELKRLLTIWLMELHEKAPGTIGDILNFRFADVQTGEGEYAFLCDTLPWMCNPTGTLHGGIIATILDQGMGMMANCMQLGQAIAPSVQLDVAYHRPLNPGDTILVRIFVTNVSRTLITMRGELFSSEKPDKLCASATGIYYVRDLH